MTSDPQFVHLHVHSSYSLLEGALTIARLAELAKADRQPALALTDTDNMFGALEFSDKMASAGIQPIIGCSLAVDFGDHEERRAPAATRAHYRAWCCWQPTKPATATSCVSPRARSWSRRRPRPPTSRCQCWRPQPKA